MSTRGYIQTGGDQDYNFGYEDFTVEFFVKPTSNSSPQTLFEITNTETANIIGSNFLTTIENGNIKAYAINTANSDVLFSITGSDISLGNTHFISAERKDNKFYLFLDGVSQENAVSANYSIPYLGSASNIANNASFFNSPATLTIGSDTLGANTFIGSFGDFKITKGVARHVRERKSKNSISSQFTDTILGTRAEDINIAGGNFVDSISSHAPEELIPTQIFDTISISVYQNSNCANLSSNIANIQAISSNISNPSFNSNNVILGFNIFKDSIEIGPIEKYSFNTGNIHGGFSVPWSSLSSDSASILINGNVLPSDHWIIQNKTLLMSAVPLNSNVKIIATGPVYYNSIGSNAVVTLNKILYSTDSTKSISNTSGFITPTPSLNIRGKVFINEECITYLYIDRINNILSGLRRGVDGTGIPSVHEINSQVISVSFDRQLPGTPGETSWYNLSNANLAGSNSNISNFFQAISLNLIIGSTIGRQGKTI